MHTLQSPPLLKIQSHCDGCGTAFVVTHALICGTGSLVIVCHNGIRDELLYLVYRDFKTSSISAKPLIHQGHTRSEKYICQGSEKDKETRGDMTIQGLWDLYIEAIIDIKLGNADTDPNNY